jgi:hypothetical protein
VSDKHAKLKSTTDMKAAEEAGSKTFMFTVFLVLAECNMRQKDKYIASATERSQNGFTYSGRPCVQPSRIELPARAKLQSKRQHAANGGRGHDSVS